jgi:signal transduction histidine kinase
LQQDLALQVSGAAALASVLIFLVRRSDTPQFMVIGEIAIVATAVVVALVVTLPRIEFFLAQVAMTFCSLGMVGYVAHAIVLSRRIRLENEETAERLRHAQKLEAVGQLTGGIAHDFNNLLAVILGNAEMLEETLAEESPMVAAIIRASERGADLTQRLLAFSRQQSLTPEAIDLEHLVTNSSELMRRTLGETIEVVTRIPGTLWQVMADRGQVENALLNLGLNARDALPDGGILAIECGNVSIDAYRAAEELGISVGDYVVISVTDDGLGMSAEVRKRAFEPFFTTKEVGQGSGLGLSMVYGFARQSGGVARLDSEVGKGTSVQIFLPRAYSTEETNNAE